MRNSLVTLLYFLLHWGCAWAFVPSVHRSVIQPPNRISSGNIHSNIRHVSLHSPTPLAARTAGDGYVAGSLFAHFIKSLIDRGIPVLIGILAIVILSAALGGDDDDDDSELERDTIIGELYSDLYEPIEKKTSWRRFLPVGKERKKEAAKLRNLGVPQEQFIKIQNLNKKYDSYEYSITEATKSKAAAAAQYRAKAFDRALELTLEGAEPLPAHAKAKLLDIEKKFLKEGGKLVAEINALQAKQARRIIDEQMEVMGIDMKKMGIDDIDPPTFNVTGDVEEKKETKVEGLHGFINSLLEPSSSQEELSKLELQFISDVIQAVGSERALGVRAALLGDIDTRGTGSLLSQLKNRPLSQVLQGLGSNETSAIKSVFLTRFPGDVLASQVAELREEVTAIVRNSKPGDEALVVLQTGGGTVTGYGLAAAQLLRLKEHGLKLTIAVEQVAASGGYMMCCVADRIIASPFAILGSIGVISDIPNVYDRLKQEGIEFQTVTAGKYKRTLTPTKKVTKEDFEKTKEDLEEVLGLFTDFVKTNRPQLNIAEVATGETWFGTAALDKGLCDEIKTVDDIVMGYIDSGYNVYEVTYSPPSETLENLSKVLPFEQTKGRWIGRPIRWLVRTVASEIKAELGDGSGSQSVEKRYMARDETAPRIMSRD